MKDLKVISLFSGCGGLDLGFQGGFSVFERSLNEKIHPEWLLNKKGNKVTLPETRFDIIFANDILSEAEAAYYNYFYKKYSTNHFLRKSIVDLVRDAESFNFVFPKADVVLGGFPCQDFSVAGKRKGFASHKSHLGVINDNVATEETRGMLYIWMKKTIEIVQPKVFVAENVKGLISLGEVKKIIEDDFRNVGEGYVVVEAKLLNAANFGVPQSRERVIFLGFNKAYLSENTIIALENGEIDPYPRVTHLLPNQQITEDLMPFVAARDVLQDLSEPELSKDLDQQHYSKAKYYGSHAQGNKEINLDGLAPTIRAEHHGNIEFRRLSLENGGVQNEELAKGHSQRRLTIRECARIQTFPDDYFFVTNKKEKNKLPLSGSGAYKVIGNAVPPLLGFHIAWHLQSIWNNLFLDK